MEIAIPSYKRPHTLWRKTLRLLRKADVPAERVTVFLADAEEKASYEEVAQGEDDVWRPRFLVGVPGIHNQRRYIHTFYPEGTHLVCLDDDVSAIKSPWSEGVSLMGLFERCFEVAAQEQCRLWGLYPADNKLYLKNRAVKGLSYVIGACYGILAGDDGIEYRWPFAEDFTRSVEYWKKGYGVLRFEGVGISTRYFKEPGGLQEFRTPEAQEAQMLEFCAAYPEDAKLRKRAGKPTDARLVRRIEKTVLAPFAVLKAAAAHGLPV